MIKYTKEDIEDLIQHLKGYSGDNQFDRMDRIKHPIVNNGYKYVVLIDFLESHFYKGSFDDGLTIPANSGCYIITWELQEQFPDFMAGLSLPDEDLPLYIADKTCYEYPVTVWRLSQRKKKISELESSILIYTKENFRSLIEYLRIYCNQYDKSETKEIRDYLNWRYAPLLDFLEDRFKRGSFDSGITIPESKGCYHISQEIKSQFPDFFQGLEISEEELSFYGDKFCYQFPIVEWRLSQQKIVSSP